MTKTISKFALATLFVAITVGMAAQAPAADTNATKKASKKQETNGAADAAKEGKGGKVPFKGTIASVDGTAKTITVGARTFQVTSATKISKGDKPATLEDAAVGDQVGGSYHKSDDGKMELVSLRIGPKPEPQPKPERKKSNQTNAPAS